jgi:hypothetical protein
MAGGGQGRLFVAAALLLGADALAGDAPGKDDFPHKARMQNGKDRRDRSFHYALPAGVVAVKGPKILTAKVGEKDLLFADIDGDGRFDRRGVDGWIVDSPNYRAFLPLEEWVVLDRTRVWLKFDEGAPFLRYRLETPDLPAVPPGLPPAEDAAAKNRIKDLEGALQDWNRLRLRNGLPPAFLDPDLTRGAMLHAAYMDKWGRGHDEDKAKELFTEEGAKAGKNSSVGPAPAVKEISFCYDSLYHRLMLFHPDLRKVGIGVGAKWTALDGLSAREKREWTWPVIIPAAGNDLVPLAFAGENPAPHPEVLDSLQRQKEAGFPITLTFPDTKVTAAEAELRVDGSDGAPVEFLLSSPEKPANPAQPMNFRSICVIPLRKLTPATTYWARVRYRWNGEAAVRTWYFRTHAAVGPR